MLRLDQRLPEHDDAVVFFSNKLWKKSDVLALGYAVALHDAVQHKAVGLCIRDEATLLSTLINLDGYVDDILILPTAADSSLIQNMMAQTQSTMLLSDYPLDTMDFPSKIIRTEEKAAHSIQSNNKKRKVTRWHLCTSGTTSTPKSFVYDTASLAKDIKPNSKSASYIWGSLYEASRFAGIQVFLQAIVSQSPLILTGDLDLQKKIERLNDGRCNSLSATPSMWRQLLMNAAISQLNLKTITLGGEIADQPILNALSKQFPEAKLRHIYATTETGVCFSVSDGLAGFPEDFLEKKEKNGSEIKIKNDELWVRDTRTSPTSLANRVVDSEGFIATGDKVAKKGSRYVFLGRDSGAINVGGQKVFPEEVEQQLLNIENVNMVKIYPKSNPILGQLVVADIVLSEQIDHSETLKKIKAYCKEHLPPFKIPYKFNIVESIDITSQGKLERRH